MSFRRMLPFILINIVVSATVVLAILFWWELRGAEPEAIALATAVAATAPAGTATAFAASLPEPTITVEPTDAPQIHVVTSGDTLLTLSQFYDVTMDDIMTINGITNPNVLSVGQELIIPIGGLPTATPVATPIPTATVLPSPNPTEPPTGGEVDLTITAVVGAGELTEEVVQIVNAGSRQIGLLNWKLTDTDGHIYTFDRFTLFGDGSGVMLHTETGENSATDLFWGLEDPIWESGEQVTLLDAEDTIQATFIVP